MLLIQRLTPDDFRTDGHYWDAFGNSETEVSARWVIRFLQDRGKGWISFTFDEINAYYLGKMVNQCCTQDFTFNALIEGTHNHMTAQTFPIGEQRPNQHSIAMEDDTFTVTDEFLSKLVSAKLLKEALEV